MSHNPNVWEHFDSSNKLTNFGAFKELGFLTTSSFTQSVEKKKKKISLENIFIKS